MILPQITTGCAPSAAGLSRVAHPEQRTYCEHVRTLFPGAFVYSRVLDVGSLDINGSNRDLFLNCEYTGIDIAPGKNVDIVSLGHKFKGESKSFDTIISTECFEHDRHYPDTLRNIIRMLKPGGLFLFTCAAEGRAEHGTFWTSPGDSPLTSKIPGWKGYYKNLCALDIMAEIDTYSLFDEHQFSVIHTTHDLQFYGIKKGETPPCSFQLSSPSSAPKKLNVV